ncbi:MAG: efflux RND transporter periplasmic adaptor subunit [Bacteroidota bacterium]
MKIFKIILSLFVVSCSSKIEKTKPTIESITESIYASGIVKSKNQYEVFANVNGIIKNVFVVEGDSVRKGSPILSISNTVQLLNKENAKLAANFANINFNQEKLNEAKSFMLLSIDKLRNDSALYFRQNALWQQQIGTKIELEQRALAYENSKNSYKSSIVRYNDLKRQLDFNSAQSKNNLAISNQVANDFVVKSNIDGIVYRLNKLQGENVGIQTPLAIIGDSKHFILEMQVDEYDILKIKKELRVLVTLESYSEKVFDAKVTKINPIMNERSRTFLVEAEFINPPEVLYPNLTFEASIVIQTKQNVLLIPRAYVLNDSLVIKYKHDTIKVKTGLKDYKKIEIISGITINDELVNPIK